MRKNFLLICVLLATINGWAQEQSGYTVKPEPYAVLSEDNKTLTFYYDSNKASSNGMDIGPFTYSYNPYLESREVVNSGWFEQRNNITTVVFDDSFAECTSITSTAYWFYRCSNLTTISGIGNLGTDNVTDMSHMFFDCSKLTSLDVSNFKTDNVTDMSCMFYYCSSLTSLDVSKFNTENVEDMRSIFYHCSSLTSLDVSKFNTEKVNDMYRMFSGCSNLTSLDVSNFNTANVENMESMFVFCSSLTSLDLSNFNTVNVEDMSEMFWDCSSLTSLNVSKFITSNVKRMNCMFCRCSNLTTLDVSNFNTGNVEDMSDMFSGCSGLTSLDVSKFNTTLVTEMGRMFSGCSGLTSLDLSFFDTDNVTDMSNMFSDCSALTTIYCEEAWNCDQSDGMFSGCTSLKGAIDFDSNNTNATYANPTDGYFTSTGKVIPRPYALLSEGNTTLTFYYDGNKKANEGMDIAFSGPKDCGWYGQRNNIKKVVFDDSFAECTTIASTAYWFYECYDLTTINGIEKLNTANVASMRDMFSCCYSLTDLDVSNFNTANVTDMIDMFACCSGLTSLDLSNFNTANVKRMNCMFYDCSDLTIIYCNDKWACGSSSDMFTGCTSLKGAISYDEEKTDVTYANPTTGYFTRKGDVNGDGIVSVADAVATMDYINKKNPDNFNAAAADMDGDGEVTVSDAIAILNMILNGQ